MAFATDLVAFSRGCPAGASNGYTRSVWTVDGVPARALRDELIGRLFASLLTTRGSEVVVDLRPVLRNYQSPAGDLEDFDFLEEIQMDLRSGQVSPSIVATPRYMSLLSGRAQRGNVLVSAMVRECPAGAEHVWYLHAVCVDG